MSINEVLAAILLEKCRSSGLNGKLATLGCQNIDFDVPSFTSYLLPEHEPYQSSDFFGWLGFDCCDSIDVSNKDGATVIADLNQPLPEEYIGSFDCVLDGGTMEHCFDVAMVMRNITHLLREEGTVIHISPTQGYCNHGFYNLQPTFFFSYYRANQFTNLSCQIVEYLSLDKRQARVIDISENFNNLDFYSTNDCLCIFSASKTTSANPVTPIQEFYYRIFKEKKIRDGAMLPQDLYARIVGDVPENDYARIMHQSTKTLCFSDWDSSSHK